MQYNDGYVKYQQVFSANNTALLANWRRYLGNRRSWTVIDTREAEIVKKVGNYRARQRVCSNILNQIQ